MEKLIKKATNNTTKLAEASNNSAIESTAIPTDAEIKNSITEPQIETLAAKTCCFFLP
jgi:hypothetical protein